MLHAEWLEVPFEPGKIEVMSYKNGKVVAKDSRVTAGEPVSIRLTPDRKTISADSLSLKGKDKALFNGKALAVIRSIKDNPGNVKLTVSSNYGVSDLVVKCK